MKLKRIERIRLHRSYDSFLNAHIISPVNLLYYKPHNLWIPTPQSHIFKNQRLWRVPCTSVRKFRRLLRQWSIYLPPGTGFVLYLKDRVVKGVTT